MWDPRWVPGKIDNGQRPKDRHSRTLAPTEESGCQIRTTLVEIGPQIGFFLPVIPFTDDLACKIKQSLAWLISLKRN